MVAAIAGTFALDVTLRDTVLFPAAFPVLLFAAFFLTPRAIAVTGSVALALALLAGYVTERLGIADYWVRLGAMAAFTILAVALAAVSRRRTRDLEEYAREAERSGQLLQEVVDAAASPVFAKAYDDDGQSGRYVLVNKAWRETTDAEDATVPLTDAALFPPAVAEALRADDLRVMRSGEPHTVDERVKPRRAEPRAFQTTTFPLRDADGRAWGVGGISTDVTDITHARERLEAMFAYSPTPTLHLRVADPGNTRALAANDALTRLIGVDLTGADSARLRGMVDDAGADDVRELLAIGVTAPLRSPHPRPRRLIRLTTADGRAVSVLASAGPIGERAEDGSQEVVIQMEDVTARVAAEEALATQALSDPVTGLPNRFALHERLAAALGRLSRRRGLVGVLFCDLDHFKLVNDTLGHPVGDRMLVEAARRLAGAVRPGDSVARLGGDEFVVLCEVLTDATEAVLVALRLRERLDEPWTYGDHVFAPTVSIGVATTSGANDSADDLLRRADLAMYRAKEAGRNQVAVYDQSLDAVVAEAQRTQERLRDALDHDGLVLRYQPIVLLADGRTVGAEALVRMRAPDGTLELPGSFIPRAEASGLIAPLGAWVLRTAFDDLRRWRHRGVALTVSVNVSPVQLHRPGFPDYLLEQASLAEVDPAWVCVEVTETALLERADTTTSHLARLHDAGMAIALDDFGTGYSSLTWLVQYPVDVVKVDRSFISQLGEDRGATALVTAVLGVAGDLGLTTVAEGVETERQAEMLRSLGCDQAQGFLFGRPVEPDDPRWTAGLAET